MVNSLKNNNLTTILLDGNVIDCLSVAFLITKIDGSISHANFVACNLLGYSLEELQEIGLKGIIEQNEKFQAHTFQTIQERVVLVELNVIRKNSEKLPVEFSSTKCCAASGEEYIVSIIHDISERKRNEREMLLLMNNTEESFILLDKSLHIISFNLQFEILYKKYFGLEVKKREHIINYVLPERKEEVVKIYEDVLQGASQESIIAVKTKDGTPKTFRIKYTPAKDEKDCIIGVFIGIQDISAIKYAELKEKEIVEQQSLYFSIINSSEDAIISITTEGIITSWNPSAERIYGFLEQEVVGKHISIITPKELIEKEVNILNKINAGISIKHYETERIKKDGRRIYITLTVSPIVDSNGKISGASKIARDITEQKIVEERLRQNEINLAEAQKLARLGSWKIDLQKNTVYWSEITKEIHEVGLKFVPTMESAFSFYRDDESQMTIMQAAEQGIKDGKRWEIEVPIITIRGNERWVRVIGEAEFKDNICISLYGSFQDISERKKTELELQVAFRKLENYQNALDQSSILAITDLNGIIIYVNENFTNISQYRENELIGNSHQIINSGFHSKDFFKEMWKTISSGEIWRGEIKNKAKDGSYYWVFTTIIPFLDKDNKPFQYLAIRHDITEKKKSVESVIKAFEEKNSILESIDDSFFAVNRDWTVTYWNRKAEKVMKIPREMIVNKNLWEIFEEKIDSISFKKYHEAIERNRSVRFEYYYSKIAKWYEVSAFPSLNGLSIYFKDITEKKMVEENLIHLNQVLKRKTHELQTSNKELEQFAYIASHDLQEPLRMITGFLSKIEERYEQQLDEKGKKYIELAVDGASRMRKIILDILEYSRIGKFSKEFNSIDTNEIVNDVIKLNRRLIEEKNAVLIFDKLPTIYAIKEPIQQVFRNLIGNSLKYAKENEALTIQITAIETPTHWQFSIADNGIGIDPQFNDKIFILFQRLHDKSEYSGTGIGLAICKKIVELHLGDIWVDSVEGKGAIFYFTISKQMVNENEEKNNSL